MARLSKTAPFQIYSDYNGIPTPDSDAHSESVKEKEEGEFETPFARAGERKDDGFVTESDDEVKGRQDDGAQEGDDERNYTRTSISSFPESSYPTDYERTPMHKPYTPTYVRPTSRRMQMASPLRKAKYGTPQSEPKGSPRTRRREFESDGDIHESKPFPLVLLHITALPVTVPWTVQSMRETLPQHAIDNLRLLKSKLSATVLKRGILIPHPREDYELLEEKLLETLELQEPRISKCGHYRARPSTDSTMTAGSTESADSGVGSSVDGSDEEHCAACHHHLRATGSGKQKWSITVFASNGLMHASAWSAAWNEMERVDVEIMPWIKDELRIKLDEMQKQELEVREIDHEADERRISQLVDERLRLLEEDTERAREAEMSREIERIVIDEQRQHSQPAHESHTAHAETATKPSHPVTASQPTSTELPNIYRPKDIPLSILLRNYIFLLARKPLNMAVFFLIVTVGGLLLTVDPAALSASVTDLSTLVMPTNLRAQVVENLPSVPLLENATQDILPEMSEAAAVVEESFGIDASLQDADMVTVSDSVSVPEHESILVELQAQGQEEGIVIEFKEQGQEDQHSVVQEIAEVLLNTAEVLPEEEVHDEEILDQTTAPEAALDVMATSESPVTHEDEEPAEIDTEHPESEEDHALSHQIDEAEAEVQGGPVPDEAYDLDVELAKQANDYTVVQQNDPSEAGMQDVSAPNEARDFDAEYSQQEAEHAVSQHNDNVENVPQASPVPEESDMFEPPGSVQAASPAKSLLFPKLPEVLQQCSTNDDKATDAVLLTQ